MSISHVLEKLLALVSPQNLDAAVNLPSTKARESYFAPAKVSSEPEFRAKLAEYIIHHYNCIGIRDYPLEHCYGKAQELIAKKHLSLESAYYQSVSGENGGFAGVCNILTEAIQAEMADQFISYQIAETVGNEFDYEYMHALMQAFVDKYAPIMPYELRSPVSLLASNWKSVIIETSMAFGRLKPNIGRY